MFGVIRAIFLAAGLVNGASLQSVTGWGSNPSNIQMSIYVPDRLASRPPVVVALHGCGGTGQQMYSSSRFQTYADQYGFILIYPSSNSNQGMACWDNHSARSLTHDGGGDTQGIVQQVQYALNKYSGDASRVYVVGFSSGAMMTNNLAATYPDVFEAGAPFAGVPAACFAGSSGSTPMTSNQTCANGQVTKSAQDWGNFARNAYAGYNGRRTRMQVWHGAADTLVVPQTFHETLKQWSNVLGLSLTGTNSNNPESGYTQYLYGDGKQLVGYLAAGAGHGGVPYHESMVLSFFGVLTTPSTSTTASRTPTTTRTTTPATTTARTSGTTTPITTPRTTPAITTTPGNPGGSQSKWGQCGGVGWTGFTACSLPAACSTLNPYYAQCL